MEKRGGGFISAHVYLSLLWFALELLQKEACLWLYRVKLFTRLSLTDLERVLWSKQYVREIRNGL